MILDKSVSVGVMASIELTPIGPGTCSFDDGVQELGWPELYNIMNEPCAIELFFVSFNSVKFKRKLGKDVKAET